MEMNEYQDYAQETAIYRGANATLAATGDITGFLYTALGLAGEAGEYANKAKKVLRDDSPVVDTESKAAELGDAQWYIAEAARQLGYTLEEVAQMNVNKLRKRKEEDHLQGSGDDR